MEKEDGKNLVIVLVILMIMFYLSFYLKDSFTTKAVSNTTIKPVLTIFYPKDNSTYTDSSLVSIRGKSTYGDVLSTKINTGEKELTLINYANWIKEITLSEGINTIELYVCKDDVCSDTRKLTLTYNSTLLNQPANQGTSNPVTNEEVIQQNAQELFEKNVEIKENFLLKFFRILFGWF